MSDTHIAAIPGKLTRLELSAFEISLYFVYKWTTNGGKECYKSLDTLSAEAGMSRTSVIKARDSLKARGLIDVETRQEGTITRQYVTTKEVPDVKRGR